MNAYLKKKPTLREKRQAVKRVVVSKTFRGFLVASTLVFGVLYLFKINTVSAHGFVISELETKLVELERENKKLDVQIASHRSVQSIEARLGGLGLVVAGDIQYAKQVGTSIALH